MSQGVQHIGFIMDGNRRFAKRLATQPWKGHTYGKNKFRDVLGWLRELNIRQATFYTFSKENFSRPKKEFAMLMDLFRDAFSDPQTRKDLDAHDIRIRFCGDLTLFPSDIIEHAHDLEKRTESNSSYVVNMAFGYSGREEVLEALRCLVACGEPITQEQLEKHLWIPDTPDMIIRTGGEHRTSNFLVWQSAYSEWFFLDKLWPEFGLDDLKSCIEQFYQRERRFGK